MDRKLPDSPPAYAELFISQISRLEWDQLDYLVEQGSHANMKVTAYDEHGSEFGLMEYRHMDLELDIDSHKHLSNGLSYERLGAYNEESRTFKVKGVSPDTYEVLVTSKQLVNGSQVASKSAKVQVFSQLKF
jgi:hypothetical protein